MQKLFKQVVVLAITLIAGMGVMIAIFDSSKVSATSYTFEVTIPDNAMLEVKLFNPDGTAMGDATSMNVSPTSLFEAGFNEKDMVVSVGTNNEWGYNLTMNVSNTSLVSQTDSSNTIPSLADKTGGYTCTVETAATCDFTVNSWGFKIKNATTTQTATNYIPVPTSINLNRNSTVTNGDPTYISFGSRIDASQKPGFYTTTINFVATANPDPTPLMQDMTASTLANLLPSSGSTTTLKDSRDGTKYTVGKLADGNYWLLDNLALDLTDSTVLNNLSKTNTNATTTSIESLQHGARSAGDQYATAAVSNWTSSYSYSAPLVNAASKDQTQPLALQQSGTGKVGVYYNYCAASAGSYCYGDGTNKGSPSGNASEDICPKGWRMPTGGSSGEYQALYTAYSSIATNFVNALKTPLSGNFYNGSADNQGTYGSFWSSTYASATGMYHLYVSTSNFSPQSSYYRYYGYSIRCLFGPLPTMQNVDSAKLAQLMPTDGSTTTLPDSRDDNVYNIARIGDAYWMTDNLKIMGTISASESNFTGADFNISAGGDLTAGKTYTVPRAHYNTSDANSSTYGAYYNYCAASAGTVCSDTAMQGATQDICPKGWRLPTETEAQAFANASSSNKNPVLAGYYFSSLRDARYYGYWWSATAGNTAYQYYLSYNGSSWNVGGNSKDCGLSIRCVAS